MIRFHANFFHGFLKKVLAKIRRTKVMKKIAVLILAVLSCLGVFAQVEFPSRYYVDRDNYSVSDLHTAMNQKEAWAYYEYGNYLYTMYKYENNGYAQLGFKRYYMQAANMGYEKAKIALSQFEDGGVDIISGGNNHNVMLATIEFLSASKTSSTSYNLRAGIKSDTKITNVSVIVNNVVVDDREIHSVVNDGYDFTLNKNLTLNYGNNTITVSVTNSSGTTSKSFNVDVSANNNNYKTVSEKRVALVIGNSNYQNSPLKNPVNDATDMAAKLRSLGFQVTFKTDLSLSGFEYALSNFKSQASNADIALLYYAGHGMEIDGRNYLIPVDAPFGDQLKYKSVDANYALDMISGSNKKIIILDACRNNPGRSINDGGLAPMSARNAFFAYSTSPGKTAPDGYGRNSPYTSALLTALSYKNLTLPQLFQEVSKIVTSKTQYQIPWTSSSLVDDVILNKN